MNRLFLVIFDKNTKDHKLIQTIVDNSTLYELLEDKYYIPEVFAQYRVNNIPLTSSPEISLTKIHSTMIRLKKQRQLFSILHNNKRKRKV